MGRKKKFIEKGEGVKFYLVHRSQKDPLYLDENVGEHVLVPVDPVENDKSKSLVEAINGLRLSGTKKTDAEKEELKRKRLQEQQKFGIYYEDDYNYLQHLKEVDDLEESSMDKVETIKIGSVLIKNEGDDESMTKPKLQLPSTVFASKHEEEIGYFNQGAPDHDPKIHWDPDIVRILDEDSNVEFDDEENQLDDDFFIKANQIVPKDGKKSEFSDENSDYDEDDDDDDDQSNKQFGSYSDSEDQSVKDFETKSRFSNYSMTSSVIRRNEGLRRLDEHFEKIFAEYDEEQIGALDTEEIEGFRHNDSVLESALEEFKKLMEEKPYKGAKPSRKNKLGVVAEQNESDAEINVNENNEGASEEEEESTEKDESSDNSDEEDSDKKDYELVRFTKKKSKEDRFDCESIVSTYSNIYNRPSLISDKSEDAKIKLSKKTGLPLGVLSEKQMSQKQMENIEHKITRVLPEIPKRSVNETKEEKKARKQAVKEHRRERRVEKKINKLAFKAEQANQITQMINNKQSSQGVKIQL